MNMTQKKNRLIPIPVPLKKGKVSLWQHKGKYVRVALVPDGKYKTFEKQVQKYAMSQLPKSWVPIKTPICLHAVFFYKGPAPDTSGCLESIGDALEGIIWENDKHIKRIYAEKSHDLKNPRIEIAIEEIF